MSFIQDDQFAFVIAENYNFAPVDATFYEMTPTPENLYVMNIANKTDNTNCLVKFQPEDFS